MPKIRISSVPEGADLYLNGKHIPLFCVLFCYTSDEQTRAMRDDPVTKLSQHLLDRGHAIERLIDSEASKSELTAVPYAYDLLFIFGHGVEDSFAAYDGSIEQSELDLMDKICSLTTCKSGLTFCRDAVDIGKAKSALGYTRNLVAQLSGGGLSNGFSECFQEAQRSIVASVEAGVTDIKAIIENAYNAAIAKYDEHIASESFWLTKDLLKIDRDNFVYYTNKGATATININSTPSGAEIWMNRYGYVGTTPITGLKVRSEGNYISEARAPGFLGGYKTVMVPDMGGSFEIPLVDSLRPVDYITDDVWIERKDTTRDPDITFNSRFVVCGGEYQGKREPTPYYHWYFCNKGSNAYSISIVATPTMTKLDPTSFTIPAHGTIICRVLHIAEESVGGTALFKIGSKEIKLLMTANIYFKRVEKSERSVNLEWNNIPDADHYMICCGRRLYVTTDTSFLFPEPYPISGITVYAMTADEKELTSVHRD